jgi:hypothetical protein
MRELNPPRSAFGATPPGGRRQRTGTAGSAAATWEQLVRATQVLLSP